MLFMQTFTRLKELIFKIKYDYISGLIARGVEVTDEIYDRRNFNSCLERWIDELNVQEYTDFISVLQTNQSKYRVLIRYGLQEMTEELWEDSNSLYRECRSIIFNMKTDRIAALTPQKFFNLNEVAENQEDVLRKEIAAAKVIEFADKLDGSMQTAFIDDGELCLAGSQSLNREKSWRLEKGYGFITKEMETMFYQNPDLTFSHELICKKDQHVVDYSQKEEALYLFGIRDKNTGRQYSYSEVKRMADFYGVKCVDVENVTFDEILVKMKQYKSNEKEGWVMYIDGRLVKLKCDDYVFMHRTIDKLASPNTVIQSIVEGNYDDLHSKAPDSVKHLIESIHNECMQYVQAMKSKVESLYAARPSNERKEFMIWANQQKKEYKPYIIRKYLGQPYHYLSDLKGNCKKMKEVRARMNAM